ncbi:MAG: RHS repeat-associated core domain-containing protein, partial [Terriglobales bacterium]
GSDSNHYKFTGKERDSESGLDEFGARYYASPLGRFMTPDWATKPTDVPYANFGNPQSLNLYSYVQNNPATVGDPDGHCAACVEEAEELLEEAEPYIEEGAETAGVAIENGASSAWNYVKGAAAAAAAYISSPSGDRELHNKELMQAQHGKSNVSNEFSNYTDQELEDAYKDPRTSASDRAKIKEEQKNRQTRRSSQSGGKKPKKEQVKNDPASVRARQNANAAPRIAPTDSQDKSSVTTTERYYLPPKKDQQ